MTLNEWIEEQCERTAYYVVVYNARREKISLVAPDCIEEESDKQSIFEEFEREGDIAMTTAIEDGRVYLVQDTEDDVLKQELVDIDDVIDRTWTPERWAKTFEIEVIR